MAEMSGSITAFPEEMMKTYQWLDELLQSQAAVEREFQPAWQAYKYLLRGKMYAYIGIHDPSSRPIITLKLDPSDGDLLRRQYKDVIPGYYMNKTHWSTVYLDGGVPRAVLTEMAGAAHKAVFSSLTKKAQREILGE